jgi:hypothetical protein
MESINDTKERAQLFRTLRVLKTQREESSIPFHMNCYCSVCQPGETELYETAVWSNMGNSTVTERH